MIAAPDVAVTSLFELLDEWRRLTLGETRAIEALDWNKLRDLHSRKTGLQTRIARREEEAFGPTSLATPKRAVEKRRLRESVEELAALERKNGELLANLMASDKRHLENSGQTLRSLRFVQKAYAKTAQSFWHSYS